MPDPWWIQEIKRILCQLYEEMGGDCADLRQLDPPEDNWAYAVMSRYATYGVASSSVPAFLSGLDDLETHLADPLNTFKSATKAAINAWIAAVRADLAAMGGA